MAKRNDGLQYFPFDVVMEETYALIEAQFGICGFAILVKLMQKIYGERGYYCDWQEENALLFSHKIGQDNQLVCKVVDAAVKRGIFNREMFRRYHILTSKSIQKIYFEATSRRRETYADSRFLLLTEEELPKNVNINGKNVNTNANNVDTNAKNDDTKQQSKVKESKGKKSKVKESKAAASHTGSPEDTVRLFEQICPRLDSTLTKAARENIKTAQKNGIDFKELFGRIERSDFLSGRSGKWRCSLDWAVTGDNAQKILGGRYDNGLSPPESTRKTSYNLSDIEALDEFA